MAHWKPTCLGDHCEITSGYPFKSAGFTDDPDDVALVKGENIGQGEILWDIAKRWPREDFEDLRRFELIPGDVVLAMDRPWIPAGLKFSKISASAPQALLVQRAARLRALDGLDQSFLPHLVASPRFVAYVQNIGRGVGVPHISGKEIGAFDFSLPPKGVQREIAGILSAYDDLIENNRRRMALLEEAARQLYREWFVRLRFPGHEHTRIIDGVPEGWEQLAMSDLADFVNGFAFKPAHLGDVGLPIIKIPELKNGVTEKTPRNDGELIPDKYRVDDGELLFSWSGTLAVNVWSSGQGLLNQHLFKVVPTGRVSRALLMSALREALDAFDRQTVGATMKHIRRSALDKVFVALPPSSMLATVEEMLASSYDQLINLSKQNQALARARDLLLPRLMSGEIAV